MRTTLTLDDDLAESLHRKARLSGRSFKQVVNEAIRSGLTRGEHAVAQQHHPFRVEPQACGLMPGIDPLRLNQLVDELEIEEAARHQAHAGGGW